MNPNYYLRGVKEGVLIFSCCFKNPDVFRYLLWWLVLQAAQMMMMHGFSWIS